MKTRRDIFQAIADPSRRAIIALIALQAMTPNAIAEHFDSSRQAVSKHLRILSECELVTQTQEGREIYYQLDLNKMKEIDKWLDQYRKIWEARFTQLDDVLLTMKNKIIIKANFEDSNDRKREVDHDLLKRKNIEKMYVDPKGLHCFMLAEHEIYYNHWKSNVVYLLNVNSSGGTHFKD